jgi:hypothetical protein
MSAESWANVIAAVSVFIAAACFIYSNWKDTSSKRSEIVRGLTEYWYGNEQLHSYFMDLLYDSRHRVDTTRLEGIKGQPQTIGLRELREDDRRMSLLLDYLNSVCYLIETRVLDLRSVCSTVLGFAIAKTWRHAGVREYIAWVDLPSAEWGPQQEAFHYLRKHAPAIIGRMYPAARATG